MELCLFLSFCLPREQAFCICCRFYKQLILTYLFFFNSKALELWDITVWLCLRVWSRAGATLEGNIFSIVWLGFFYGLLQLLCVFSFQRTVSAQHIIWNKGNLAAPSVFTSSQLALRCQYSFSNIFHVFLILPNYTEAALHQSKPLPSKLLPQPLGGQPASCVSTSTEIGFLKLL